MDVGSIPTSSNISIYSQVAEGIGLIIRFSLKRRWFESSQMQVKVATPCLSKHNIC